MVAATASAGPRRSPAHEGASGTADSPPRPVTPSHSASRTTAATTASTISARRRGGATACARTGRRGPAPRRAAGRPAHAARRRAAAGSAASGTSLLRALMVTLPPEAVSRPGAVRGWSQPAAASTDHRSPAAVAATRRPPGSAPRPGRATRRRRPAPRRRRSRQPRRHGSGPRPATVASRRRSRTARPPVRSTRGGPGPPVGRELVDQPEQLRGLPAGRVVDRVGRVRGQLQRRRLEVQVAVQSTAAQPQRHLARHHDVVGRQRADQLRGEQPGSPRSRSARRCRARRPVAPR